MPSRSGSSSSDDEREHQSISGETQTSRDNQIKAQAAKADDQISVTETNTIRSSSPTLSHKSETITQQSFDAVSINTTTSTNVATGTVTTATATDAKQKEPSNIPIIPPPVVPGPAQPQPRPDTNVFNRPPVQGAVGGNATNQIRNQPNTQFIPAQQQQPQQTLFPNQIPPNQAYNELLGPDAFKDVMLNIDYGALDAYNIGMQAPYTFPFAQTTGGQGFGGQFDAAKALFNQVDTNQDGAISQEEFRQWAQRGSQAYAGQSYGNFQGENRQGNVVEYQATASFGNNFNTAQLFDGASPEIANILRQSGING